MPHGSSPARRTSPAPPRRLAGYASVFYDPADPGTEFVLDEDAGGVLVERIDPRAFDAALREKGDIRALFNHSANMVLGRTSAKTLLLRTDRVGLRYEVELPDSGLGDDLAEVVSRGDVTGSSFAFHTEEADYAEYRRPDGSELIVRHIREAKLLDVGPVTFPAYAAASCAMAGADPYRSIDARAGRFAVARRLRFLAANAPDRRPFHKSPFGRQVRADDDPASRAEKAHGTRHVRLVLAHDLAQLVDRRTALQARRSVGERGTPGESRAAALASIDAQLLFVGASLRALLKASDRVTSDK